MPRLVEAVATFVLNGAICTKLLYKLCLIFYNGDMQIELRALSNDFIHAQDHALILLPGVRVGKGIYF